MSTKYLDYAGLSYFWSKLKAYVATTSHSGLMSATDKAKVDAITNQGTIAYYRKMESVYITQSANETTIPIGISGFSTADMLLVDINGLDLSEGEEYEISGTNIVLDTPIGTVGTVVHFVALRAVTATSADVATLKGEKGDDGVVQDVLQNGVSVLGQDGVARIVINVLDTFYPVGSFYETSDSTFDPNVTWGGTWVLETAGLVHVSAGTGYTIGDTGGEASHTLTTDEMPSHEGHLYNNTGSVTGSGNASGKYLSSMNSYGSSPRGWRDIGNEYFPMGYSRGSGTAHNNMQPYIIVNRWHRTA